MRLRSGSLWHWKGVVKGETNPCASFFASLQDAGAWGRTYLLPLTIIRIGNAGKGVAEKESLYSTQQREKKRYAVHM
jgi:hypothetical protein